MREADFEVLLRLVERLSDEQQGALGRALASASGEPEAVRLLEGHLPLLHAALIALQRSCSAGGRRAGYAAIAAKAAARASTR